MKEFRCLAHGPFDAKEPVCPHGCSTVLREFRTAPAGKSAKTKLSDRALEHLSKRYGLSDMSNKGGSVGASRKRDNSMAPVWGEMPKGNVFVPGKGEVDAKGQALTTTGGAAAALAGMGITGESVAAALGRKLGRELAPEPTFMDITKTLPKLRPKIVLHDGKFENASQLDALIK